MSAKVPAGELTIDDLAAKLRLPSRTIRFYQSQGLLPKPELRGRVAMYGDAHVKRLELVAELQDRGLQIKAIGELLKRVDKGEASVQDWLGINEELKAPLGDDQPKLMSLSELGAITGELGPGRLSELLRAGFVERRGDAFLVESPAMLALSVKLERAGASLDAIAQSKLLLEKRLGKVASELAETLLPKKRGAALASIVRELRPAAIEATKLVFTRELERVLREWLNSGRALKK